MKQNLDCTIIFLSFNSRLVTDTCLKKLKISIDYARSKLQNKIDVIVVDNASIDKSAEMILRKYTYAKLIALKNNIGYSAGNNLAMSKAKTPYILLMNSDTYVYKDSLKKIISTLATNAKKYDVLVSRYSSRKSEHENHGGYLPTPLRLILWSLGFESIPFIKKYLKKIYALNKDNYYSEGFVEWYSPCFMLIKRKVYEKTQGYDEKLWFHMVDVEWCKRIKDCGFKMYYVPDIYVKHLGGASSKGIEYKLLRDNFRGVLYYLRKHYPGKLFIVGIFLKAGLMVRGVFYMLAGKINLAKAYLAISVSLKI